MFVTDPIQLPHEPQGFNVEYSLPELELRRQERLELAGMAMQGIIARYGLNQEKPPTMAASAVECADALIAALATVEGTPT